MTYREKMRQNLMIKLEKYIKELPKKLSDMECDIDLECKDCPLKNLHICSDPNAVFNWDQEMPKRHSH